MLALVPGPAVPAARRNPSSCRRLARATLAIMAVLAAAFPAAAAAVPPAPSLDSVQWQRCPWGVQLAWSQPAGEIPAEYDVVVHHGGSASTMATVPGDRRSHFLDTGVYGGETQAFSVRAVGADGLSAESNQVTATIPDWAPPAPAGLAASYEGTSVRLTWAADDACSYVITRDPPFPGPEHVYPVTRTAAGGSTSYVDTEAVHGTATYTLAGVDQDGFSVAESSVTIAEPLPQVGGFATCAGRGAELTPKTVQEASVATLCLMNFQRVSAGLPPLFTDPRLNTIAVAHARDMAARDFFDHTNPDGCDPSCRARAAGYPVGAGENIAQGYQTPEDVVTGWMNSTGHRQNILRDSYRTFGHGTAPDGRQWVHTFGREPALLAGDAVTGLEPRFQGAPGGGCEITGLRVTRTRSGKLKLRGRICPEAGAGGKVKVKAKAGKRTWKGRAAVKRGRLTLTRKLPRALRRASALTLVIRFTGNDAAGPATQRLRLS